MQVKPLVLEWLMVGLLYTSGLKIENYWQASTNNRFLQSQNWFSISEPYSAFGTKNSKAKTGTDAG